MNKWRTVFTRFSADETGATSIEYALMGSLIAIVCIAALVSVGGNLELLYTLVCNEVSEAISGAPGC